MADTYKLSQKGFDNLIKERDTLKNTTRPKAVTRLTAARAMGDLAENSEYTASREGLSLIDTRLAQIEAIINKVEIVNETKNTGVVQLGDVVKVKVQDGHEEFSIVGEMESDPMNKKISDSSPIGKAILGAKVGSSVTVTTPAGEVVYKVVEIKK